MKPIPLALLLTCLVLALLVALVPAKARKSTTGRPIIARDAQKVKLKAGMYKGKQVAVARFYCKGRSNFQKKVLIWGALNAIEYSPSKKPPTFKVDYSGGYKAFQDPRAWQKIKNQCKPNDELKKKFPGVVAACTMPNGEHWMLQEWQRLAPNYGAQPTGTAMKTELHVSHFTDAYIPVLWLKWGWSKSADKVYDHLYGVFSCNGFPVYGAKATKLGVPLDDYGRNIYVDVKNAAWKKSGAYTKKGDWHTFNSFLAHKGNGAFCASVYPKMFGITRPGYDQSTRFRATAMGPGVTPIVQWEGPPPGSYAPGGFLGNNYRSLPSNLPKSDSPRKPYSEDLAKALNQEQRAIVGADDPCYKVYGPY